MKKILLGVLLSIVILLIFIITMTPASVIISMIQERLPDKFKAVQLYGVEGSIWSPSISSLEYRKTRIQNIQASINPFNLFLGDLKSTVSVKDPAIKLLTQISANEKNLQLTGVTYHVSAEFFDPFMEFPVKSLAGDISGDFENLVFKSNGEWQQVNGNGNWLNAAIAYLDQNLLLGHFEYQVKTSETNELVIEILKNEGPLDLKGNLTLTPSRQYRLDVTTAKSLPNKLNSWISKLARLENDRYRIQWKGTLK